MVDDGRGTRGSSIRMNRPIAIDLFSGCGGLTAGLKAAGFKVVAAVEQDELAASTYRRNHRATALLRRDIRSITGPDLLTAAGLPSDTRVDLLAGCPPCQGFSRMRTKNATRAAKDDRNDLVFDYLRLVRSLRPRAVMLENVPALRHDNRFRIILSDLKRLGYEVDYDVLDAASYEVPQRRRRLIMIGVRGRKVSLAQPASNRQTVRKALDKLRGLRRSDPLHLRRSNHSARIENLIRHIPLNGGSRSALPEELRLACHDATDGFKDVYGRMKWDSVAPTITGGCFNPSKGRFLHPQHHRAISLREAAVLQGFPVKYYFPVEARMESLALMIGNALPPPFIAAHAGILRRALHGIKQDTNSSATRSESNSGTSKSRSRRK